MENQSSINKEEWLRNLYQDALKYLANKGIITTGIDKNKCQHLGPFIAIWKLSEANGKSYWVVNGEVPTDHLNIEVADNARDVLRHFSFKWQMQADSLMNSNDNAQKEFGALLVKSAENVYKVFEDDKVWQNLMA